MLLNEIRRSCLDADVFKVLAHHQHLLLADKFWKAICQLHTQFNYPSS